MINLNERKKHVLKKFSIVIPIRDEVDYIPRTLPSYLALKPNEVVLCLDDPAPQDVLEAIEKVSQQYKAEKTLKILRIPKGGWGDQQMKVRRTGFLEARNDRILTGDIDLIVNRNVLKAVNSIGKNDVGMASCGKLRHPHNLTGIYRLLGEKFLSKYVRRIANFVDKSNTVIGFTGLYALWRPFWLNAEPLDEAKKYSMVKQKIGDGKPLTLKDFMQTGEDSFLRSHMIKKHKAIHISDNCATVLSDPLIDQPLIQYTLGICSAMRGRNWLTTLVRTFFRLQPYYLIGYRYGRRFRRVMNIQDFRIKLDRKRFGYGKWKKGGTPVE